MDSEETKNQKDTQKQIPKSPTIAAYFTYARCTKRLSAAELIHNLSTWKPAPKLQILVRSPSCNKEQSLML